MYTTRNPKKVQIMLSWQLTYHFFSSGVKLTLHTKSIYQQEFFIFLLLEVPCFAVDILKRDLKSHPPGYQHLFLYFLVEFSFVMHDKVNIRPNFYSGVWRFYILI